MQLKVNSNILLTLLLALIPFSVYTVLSKLDKPIKRNHLL
jgi:hypothetical protein